MVGAKYSRDLALSNEIRIATERLISVANNLFPDNDVCIYFLSEKDYYVFLGNGRARWEVIAKAPELVHGKVEVAEDEKATVLLYALADKGEILKLRSRHNFTQPSPDTYLLYKGLCELSAVKTDLEKETPQIKAPTGTDSALSIFRACKYAGAILGFEESLPMLLNAFHAHLDALHLFRRARKSGLTAVGEKVYSERPSVGLFELCGLIAGGNAPILELIEQYEGWITGVDKCVHKVSLDTLEKLYGLVEILDKYEEQSFTSTQALKDSLNKFGI